MAARVYDPERHCGAKAKQNNHEPCRQPRLPGQRRCRFHGGVVPERNSQETHGLYRRSLSEQLRPGYESALASVREDGGVAATEGGAALRMAAVAQYLSSHPAGPETPEEREAFFRCLRGIDEGVAARKALLEEKTAEPTGFVINLAQPGQSSITVRTPSGPAVALRAPDGGLLLPDGSGRYVPAIKRIVDDVELYEPALLERSLPTNGE